MKPEVKEVSQKSAKEHKIESRKSSSGHKSMRQSNNFLNTRKSTIANIDN